MLYKQNPDRRDTTRRSEQSNRLNDENLQPVPRQSDVEYWWIAIRPSFFLFFPPLPVVYSSIFSFVFEGGGRPTVYWKRLPSTGKNINPWKGKPIVNSPLVRESYPRFCFTSEARVSLATHPEYTTG